MLAGSWVKKMSVQEMQLIPTMCSQFQFHTKFMQHKWFSVPDFVLLEEKILT